MRCIVAMIALLLMSHGVYGSDVGDLQAGAVSSMASSDYSAALQQLSAALEMEPENAYTNYLVALAHVDSDGDPEVAAKYLETAEAAGAQPQAVALLRARIFVLQGRRDDALTEIERLSSEGYAQYRRIDEQDDFESLREEPRFQAAIKEIRAARFPCEADDRHHDFDFWVGDWDVYQGGVLAGRNQISSILSRCLVFEQWESSSGGLGKSFNYYDPGKDHWRQIWVADTGTIIEFTGKARDGGIYYTAETSDPATGDVTHHRFEFTKHPEGGVRQFWAISTDLEEWATIWDGHYRRRPANGE